MRTVLGWILYIVFAGAFCILTGCQTHAPSGLKSGVEGEKGQVRRISGSSSISTERELETGKTKVVGKIEFKW